MKPGYQTSEFWIACGTQITAFIVALSGSDTTAKIMAGGTALAAVLAYIVSRHLAKVAAAAAEAAKINGTDVSTAGSLSRQQIPTSILGVVGVVLALLLFAGSATAQHRRVACPGCVGGGVNLDPCVRYACPCKDTGVCICPGGQCDCLTCDAKAMPTATGFTLQIGAAPPVYVAPLPPPPGYPQYLYPPPPAWGFGLRLGWGRYHYRR